METPSKTQSLCLTCGICCDGTLLGKVKLRDGDPQQPLKAVGIQIETKDTKSSFRLGCAGYRGNSCQIYADRPESCRSFRCELLKKYESGAVSLAEAQGKIDHVKNLRNSLIEELKKTLPERSEMSVPALLKIAPEQKELLSNPDLLKKWGPVLLCLSALSDRLRSDFWSNDKHIEGE
ncbi:MAG: YkgJ family cysteine cluster protein [Pyrinomonadaceae bacterium]|nr:YkgJ family cysteine cluster protein [Pyrinomonadaceae bacterium]